jgi:hypothetical protein
MVKPYDITSVLFRRLENVLFPDLRSLSVVQQTIVYEVESGLFLKPFALGEVARKLLLRNVIDQTVVMRIPE